MDDGVILDLHPIVKDLLPHNVPVVGGVGADYVQQLLDVDRLQFVVVACHVPLFHEVRDVRVALPENTHHRIGLIYHLWTSTSINLASFEINSPAFEVNLVSAKVEILVWEHLGDTDDDDDDGDDNDDDNDGDDDDDGDEYDKV